MKKRLFTLMVGILSVAMLCSICAFGVSGSEEEPYEIPVIIDDAINWTTEGVVIPHSADDHLERLREELGDELFQECLIADPASWIHTDPVTGEMSIMTPEDDDCTSTEPYIPEDVEIAKEFLSPISAKTYGEIDYPSNSKYPYRTNAFLQVTFPDGYSGTASGVFVGDDLVLTAGHAIQDRVHRKASKVTVTPGGSTSRLESATMTSSNTPVGWKVHYNPLWDYKNK